MSTIDCPIPQSGYGAYMSLRAAEQDEDLESLEKTVHSTKHIALAVNEELDLHTRLLVRCY